MRDCHVAAGLLVGLQTSTCSVCGFVMNDVGVCPRCKLIAEEQAHGLVDTGEDRSVLDQVADLLAGLGM